MTTLKKTYFYRVFWPFPFSFFFFFFFLFLGLQHKKGKNKKCNFLFENLIFDIPQILQKHYFDTVALFVFLKMPKNTIKLGKNSKKKMDQFLTLDLDQFLTLETPNLGPVFNSTAYIYIYADAPEFWATICLYLVFVCLFHEERGLLHLRGMQSPNQSLLAWQLREMQL